MSWKQRLNDWWNQFRYRGMHKRQPLDQWADSLRCVYVTAQGTRCKRQAAFGRSYCVFHDHTPREKNTVTTKS